jgi:hypothetical protein
MNNQLSSETEVTASISQRFGLLHILEVVALHFAGIVVSETVSSKQVPLP